MIRKTSQQFFNSPFLLLISGGISLIIYLSFIFVANGLKWEEVRSFFEFSPSFGRFFQSSSYLLFLFYFLVLIWAKKQSALKTIRPYHWKIGLFFFFLFCLVLLFTPPLTSKDVFWNLFQGRIFAHYGENPYLLSPQNFPQDPYSIPIRIWQDVPMTYGPLWTLLVSAVSALFPENLYFQILLLRFFLFLALLFLIGLLVFIVNRMDPHWSFPAFIALAWQPLLLINTISDAHNDILVALTALLGLFLISRDHYLSGFTILGAGALVKYAPLFLIPLAMIFIFFRQGFKKAFKSILISISAVILLSLIAYSPFGYNIHQYLGLKFYLSIFSFPFLPPLPFFLTTIWAGLRGITIPIQEIRTIQEIRILSTIIFLIFYFRLLFLPFRTQTDLFKRGFMIFTTYLLIAPFWFMAWYLIWLIPLAVISGLGTTLIALGLSLIAFPYPFPIFQVMTLSVGFGIVILLVIKKLIIRKAKKEFIQEC